MKKVVLKVELYDDKVKQKAMKVVSGLSGVDSIAMDMKDKKLTVTGDHIDPVTIVGKLRKLCHTEILTVGPAKEPEKKKEEPEKKKDDPKKEEQPKKKDDPKKEEPKKKEEQPKKKDEPKKDEKKKEAKDDGSQSQGMKAMAYPIYTQPPYYPQPQPQPQQQPQQPSYYYPQVQQQHPYYPPQLQPYYPQQQQQVYYNQQAYNYQQSPVATHYYHTSVEEDPNSCVIC